MGRIIENATLLKIGGKKLDISNQSRARNRYQYVVFFCLILFIHCFMNLTIRDDQQMALHIQQLGWFPAMENYYTTWYPRVIIMVVSTLLCLIPSAVWIILDTLLYVLLSYTLMELASGKRGLRKHVDTTRFYILVCVITLLYPMVYNGTAGWVSTTANYSWVAILALYSLLIPKKLLCSQEIIRKREYVTCGLAVVFATSHEIANIYLMILYCFVLAVLIMQTKNHVFLFVMIGICLINFAIFLLCPGNGNRYGAETVTWFPDYGTLSLTKKLDLAVSISLWESITCFGLVMIALTLLLATAVFATQKSIILRILGATPLAMVLLSYCRITGPFPQSFAQLGFLKKVQEALQNPLTLYGGIDISNYLRWETYFTYAYIIIMFALIILGIYLVFGNSLKTVGLTLGIVLGIGSKGGMAFSPTVWASGVRTNTFMIFSLLTCMTLLLYRVYSYGSAKLKQKVFFGGFGLGIIVYIGTIFNVKSWI